MSILEIYNMGFSEWQICNFNPPVSMLRIHRRDAECAEGLLPFILLYNFPIALINILEYRWLPTSKPNSSAVLQGIEMNLVMFDLDGTLIESSTLDTRCLLGAIEMSMGIRNADSDWTKYRYVTDAGIASEIVERHLNRPVTEKELHLICSNLTELLRREAETNREKFAPLPGALDLIRTLKTVGGCGFSIATGCWKDSALFKLSKAGFDLVNAPLASSDDSCHREEIMACACERAKVFYDVDGFKTITYVGDGLWDLKSSQGMRYHFIGIASGIDEAAFRKEGASYVLKDFSDKAAFLAAMNEIWSQHR